MGAHAQLGASGASRWMACPGSIRLAEGIPDTPSPYAAEGTVAHGIAEQALLLRLNADAFVGREVEADGMTFMVDAEMAEAVQVYLDAVRASMVEDADAVLYAEERVTLDALTPPAPMFGTADAVIWKPNQRVLEVWDYKHGRGVDVQAVDNPQPRYYALGAVLSLRVKPDTIHLHIVQPRSGGDDVKSDSLSWAELVEFKDELLAAAHRTTEPDAPLTPGSHCRFCRALPVCPAQKSMAVTVAQQEFEIIQEPTLPKPEHLTDDQMNLILEKAPLIEAWFSSIRDHFHTRMEAGEDIEGWKLVAKRATRKWADEEAVEKYLRRKLKVAGTYKKTLISPAQAEKALKKAGQDLPDQFVVSVSSGTNLVPADNPRPAVEVIKAADEFTAIQAGD